MVAPISAPMLHIVPIPVQERECTPGPKYSTIAPVPPFTVKMSATFRMTSFGDVHALISPENGKISIVILWYLGLTALYRWIPYNLQKLEQIKKETQNEPNHCCYRQSVNFKTEQLPKLNYKASQVRQCLLVPVQCCKNYTHTSKMYADNFRTLQLPRNTSHDIYCICPANTDKNAA